MKKRSLKTTIFILLMVISLFCTSAAALEIEGGANETGELTDAEQQEVLRANEQIQAALDAQNLSRASSMPNVPFKLSITPRMQKNSYYCGVASVQMVLECCTGKSWNQTKIGDDLNIGTSGASSDQLAKYLRDAGEKYQRTTLYDSDFEHDVLYSLTAVHPMIASVKDGFPYKIRTGHFVCIHGFKRDDNMNVNTIHYIDPVDNNDYFGKQSMSFDDMCYAIDSNVGNYIRFVG